jgi:hypothetical protein
MCPSNAVDQTLADPAIWSGCLLRLGVHTLSKKQSPSLFSATSRYWEILVWAVSHNRRKAAHNDLGMMW